MDLDLVVGGMHTAQSQNEGDGAVHFCAARVEAMFRRVWKAKPSPGAFQTPLYQLTGGLAVAAFKEQYLSRHDASYRAQSAGNAVD